jgi:tRNA(Ile)-lysidine synthase
LQSLRGGGLSAVAGMASLARFGSDHWHARPLLAFTRAELVEWARGQGLSWLEDPSNADTRFDRNFLRLEVLPRLRERWPAAARSCGRIAEYARDALALEQETAARDLLKLLQGCALDLQALRRLPEPRQRSALRGWLRGCGLDVPSRAVLEALRNDALRAAPDRNPTTRWPGAAVHRYRGRLYASAEAAGAKTGPVAAHRALAPGETLAWPAGGTLQLVPSHDGGLDVGRLGDGLTVRTRRDGEAFVPAGSAHRRDLRKWLQERGVLPWRRADLPILCDAAGQIVAIADLTVAANCAAAADKPAWRLAWQGRGVVTESDALALRWPVHPPIR